MLEKLLAQTRPALHRLPVVGEGLAFGDDPLGFLLRQARRGGVTTFRLGPMHAALVADPPRIADVLIHQRKRYSRNTRVYATMRKFLGRGILTSDGEHWRKHRRIVQPAFHRRRLQTYADFMVRSAIEAAARWRTDSVIDVAEEMMQLTLRIVSETLFGANTDDEAQAIGAAIDAGQRFTENVIKRIVPIPEWLPTEDNRRFREAVAELDRVAYRLIDARLAKKAAGEALGDDVLSMLVLARTEDGQSLPREQIRDEVLTLLAAGHETTANALSWTFELLSRHPLVLQKLRTEVNTVLGDRAATIEDVPALRYARFVFDESLRVRPPVFLTGRIVLEAHELGGVALAPDTLVLLSPWVTGRDERYFPNPEGFDPDRWEALSQPKALPPMAFFPFGGGARKCVGEAMAYLEGVLVLATLVQRVSLELVPGHPVVPATQITMGLEHGLRMRVRRTNGSAPSPSLGGRV